MSPSAQETVTSAPLAQRAGRVVGADHGGDAELARDDRRVAGAAAAVGDDRGRRLHHRLPVRRRGVGDQHLAGPELGRGAGASLTIRTLPAAHAAADRAAGGQRLAVARRSRSSSSTVRLALRGDRLGPRLHDVELAVDAVLAPTRCPSASGGRPSPAVVVLDRDRVVGERQHLARRSMQKRSRSAFERRHVEHGLAGAALRHRPS